MDTSLTRRQALQAVSLLCALPGLPAATAPKGTMLTRTIPGSGEALAAVGLGTWQTFDAGGGEEERRPLREVVRLFFQLGGRLIDSSTMYGRAESVVGELLSSLKPAPAPSPFLATKVWTQGREEGIRQMEASIRKMGAPPKLDLMQVHNLVDWKVHLETLAGWKQAGRVRYVGVTHYSLGAFEQLEQLIRSKKVDFVQLPYSVAVRSAEERLLPAAAEHGVAVIVMRPFEGGALFQKLRGTPLPSWAADVDCASWAQLFLKFILGHPAVTCVIPATSKPHHLQDNMGAGAGRLPTEAQRRQIAGLVAR